MNNKKAQGGLPTLGIVFMVAVFLFLVGLSLTNIFKEEITNARSSVLCSTDTISDGAKLLCLGIDLIIPLFIATVFAAAGGMITARLLN